MLYSSSGLQHLFHNTKKPSQFPSHFKTISVVCSLLYFPKWPPDIKKGISSKKQAIDTQSDIPFSFLLSSLWRDLSDTQSDRVLLPSKDCFLPLMGSHVLYGKLFFKSIFKAVLAFFNVTRTFISIQRPHWVSKMILLLQNIRCHFFSISSK